MMRQATRSFLTAVSAVISSTVVSAATYTGKGTDPSDISKTDNWTPSSWSASETLTLNGSTNALAYKMTAALPTANTLQITGFVDNRTIDFGDCLTTVSKLSPMGNKDGKKITLNGGADNLTEIWVESNTGVVLSDGAYHIGTGRFLLYSWNAKMWINSGGVADIALAGNMIRLD